MKKICLIGPVDKRTLTYPLFKFLDLTGKTLIISDDGIYRKFDDEYAQLFTKGRLDFKIIPNVDGDTLSSISTTGYDYVVYIVGNQIVSNCDNYIYCHSRNKGICTNDVIACLENNIVDFKDVVITTGMLKEKGILKMGIDKDTMGYVWDCEEANEFLPTKNPKITKLVAYVFSDILDISQDTIVKALGRANE